MPFLIPIAAGIAGIVGAISSHSAEQNQKKALTQEEQIAQQQMQDKQKTFNQLDSFYSPYTQSGSPFLSNIQSAAAAQNAQQTNNAAGTFREQMGATGLGFGPSGATAAGLANIGSNAASTGASNYLSNLLQNEQIKFQAAQGLQGAGQMAGATQNQPNVSTQLPPANFASSIGALGNIFKTLGSGGSNSPNQVPQTVPGSSPVPDVIANSTGIPSMGVPTQPGSTGGWSI